METALDFDQLGLGSSHPIWRIGASTFPVKYGRSVIERILPHRNPMLLLDTITHVDIQQGGLRAQRRTDPNDPIFEGHLPGQPIYPVVLLLETVAQAAGCLAYFHAAHEPAVGKPARPWLEEKLVVHRACFPRPIRPGDGIAVLVKILAVGEISLTFAGQVLRDDEVCATVVVELGIGLATDSAGTKGSKE